MTVAPQSGWPPTFGRYLLYGEIASGGMATVHFGRLQGAAGFARSVAIKRLHPQYAKDPDFVAMFLDEARLAARIAHPNVVPTLDVVTQGDELLLVMEYVRGSSLSRLLRTLSQRSERMPPRIAAAIAAGVLRGLHAAHEARSETGDALDIVHRDVSPQNILVGADGIARLLDFGVAKAAGRVQTTRDGQLKGKLAYMAPEQITTGSVTRKTDIYAAAVVLWEMLTGRRLFRAENEGKLLALVLDGDVVPPSKLVEGLDSGFDRVVLRGLDRDPAKRFATAREMAIEVEGIIGIAPSTEVGEWVETVAADELRERAHRIEEIERSMHGSSPSAVSSQIALPVPASSAVRLTEDASTADLVSKRAPPPADAPVPVLASHVASPPSVPSFSTTDRPPSSKSRRLGVVATTTVAAAVAVASFLAFHPPHPRGHAATATAVAAPATPSVSATSSPPLRVASEAPRTEAPSPVVPAARAMPPSADAPPAAKALSAASPAAVEGAMANSARPVAHSTVSFPPPAPAGASPHHGPIVDCNPPYTTDARGHIHFKPACVN